MFLTHSQDQAASDDYRHPKSISSSFPDFTVERGRAMEYKQIEDNVPDKIHPHPPCSLGDHHSLPTLDGAFAALFQARAPALRTAVYTHRDAEQTQKTDSARTKQNKGSQSPLSICLRQSLQCHTHVYTVYIIFTLRNTMHQTVRG